VYSDGQLRLFDILRVFALGYLFTGSIWALFFLLGFRPFDFTLTIVSLTVAHFHVAGFVLTVAIAGLWRKKPNFGHRLLGFAALLGMPSVAAGITLTQLGFPPFVEWFSGFLFALMAGGTAIAYGFLAKQSHGNQAIFWRISAFSLVFGAILAALYALRFHFPLSFIHIPNMKLLHGTVNTLGFGWCCLKGMLQE
jgi:YndJ-like protein